MKRYILQFLALMLAIPAMSKDIELLSPSREYSAVIKVGSHVSIDFKKESKIILTAKDIFLNTDQGQIPCENAKIKRVLTNKVDRIITPAIKEKNGQIVDKYNETTIRLSDNSSIVVRLYDNGGAYRIVSNKEGEIIINEESANYIIDTTSKLIWQTDNRSTNCGETVYAETSISKATQDTKANLPALVKLPSGENILFLESDVHDYPVMWLKKDGDAIRTHFWNFPKSFLNNGDKYNDKKVTEVEEFIAKTSGKRSFPWRAFAFSNDDSGLLSNQLVYLLASDCRLDDTSWIQPGWVTLDWWSRRALFGVDFKGGINTATAKYMIDFAAHYGLKYFLFDDGWTNKNNDLTQTIPEVDMPDVCNYANAKGVNVMLWVTHDMFETQMEKALDQFSKWGIKGIKIDFMDRNDQLISNFYEKASEEAAKHHMVIDFHGCCTPNGLRRMYPNVLTREGLIEFEFSAWSKCDDPHYHCILPFIRGVAGPSDYIPCTTYNRTKGEFRTTNPPSGQGTRAHSMALSVVIESPMHMLADPQSDYYKENECTEFFTAIPLNWDETIPLNCKFGEYVSIARRNGNDWYVAAITDWTARDFKIDLSFLPKGNYKVEFFKDGVNANVRAIDYVKGYENVKSGDILNISMAPGGGWIAKISLN